jgi:GTP-sensing pleiotropic transcriptional regulator CodY
LDQSELATRIVKCLRDTEIVTKMWNARGITDEISADILNVLDISAAIPAPTTLQMERASPTCTTTTTTTTIATYDC